MREIHIYEHIQVYTYLALKSIQIYTHHFVSVTLYIRWIKVDIS